MDSLISDWQNTMVGKLKVTSSPRYAYMNGKPVVCFWGFGLSTYSDSAPDALRAITWFKTNGYYVIGGTPTNWRTGTSDSKPGYQQVYAAYDMVSPWTVGRYKLNSEVDNYKANFLVPDKARLDSQGIAFQPVIFPGFAWSNWNGGAQNAFPRNQGKFMWRQFYNIKSLGIKHVYVAMFDEYDEGTAICKAAADYFDAPTNQYFQTTSIDSVYVSSDFYLRLAGAAANALKQTAPVADSVPIANSVGPIFFRSSFEPVDAQLTWVSAADSASDGFQNVTGYSGNGSPECAVVNGTAASGAGAVRFRGSVTSTASAKAYFKAIRVNIPVSSGLSLSYAFNPQNELSRCAGIDLATTDGTYLRATAAVDTNGISTNPGVARGAVGSWTTIKCDIGKWLAGKTISRVLVAFDHTGTTGQFAGSIDNLVLKNDSASTLVHKGGSSPDARAVPTIFSLSYAHGVLYFNGVPRGVSATVDVFNGRGELTTSKRYLGDALPVQLRKGVYFVCARAGKVVWKRTMVVTE
jgi:hypothetical protein